MFSSCRPLFFILIVASNDHGARNYDHRSSLLCRVFTHTSTRRSFHCQHSDGRMHALSQIPSEIVSCQMHTLRLFGTWWRFDSSQSLSAVTCGSHAPSSCQPHVNLDIAVIPSLSPLSYSTTFFSVFLIDSFRIQCRSVDRLISHTPLQTKLIFESFTIHTTFIFQQFFFYFFYVIFIKISIFKTNFIPANLFSQNGQPPRVDLLDFVTSDICDL